MTDRPIIFSAPMVRALLDGRKTQDRRVLKPSPEFCGGGRSRDPQNWNDPDAWGWENYDEGCWDLLSEGYTGRPFYAPGDLLWVREAWKPGAWRDDARVAVDYLASPEETNTPWIALPDSVDWDDLWCRWTDEVRAAGAVLADDGRYHWEPGRSPMRWRSPIHMPRWASRLTLLVTDVRVQRLQEISQGDAMEEGCPFANMADGLNPRDWYRHIWNSINGPDAWGANPWVAAISFTVHRCNIDAFAQEMADD